MKYLSPKQLGKAIGVSESSLKRWIDDGQLDVIRTTGGHRRIALSEAVRFVRLRGYDVADPAVLGLTAADEVAGRADAAQRVEHFHDLLTKGKDKEFVAAVTRLYLDGHLLSELIDGPIRGAMSRIGELWHSDPDGVGIEHRATDICIRTLGYLHALIKSPAADAPLAIGGAPQGDMHLISSLCVSMVLAEQGWRQANLGANTPWAQLLSAARREKASLVWVSMTTEPNADYPKNIRELADALAQLHCQLVVGGRQLSPDILRMDMDNLHTARSMAELHSFSRGLLAAHKSMNATPASNNDLPQQS